MGQLPSKLCKNENKTDIPFYKVYLPEYIENS